MFCANARLREAAGRGFPIRFGERWGNSLSEIVSLSFDEWRSRSACEHAAYDERRRAAAFPRGSATRKLHGTALRTAPT